MANVASALPLPGCGMVGVVGCGHGARLGRVESLRQQGITPISPDVGVEILERLLRQRVPAVAVVVTGRFGDLPTLKLEKPELPFLRFLENRACFIREWN